MPPRGSGRRALAAPALVLALGVWLAACTDGGSAMPTATVTVIPTVTPSATPSPTPLPTPVTEPPTPAQAMATGNADGATVAAEHFMALYTYARLSGDPSLLAEMSDPGCSTCAAIVNEVNTTREQGRRAEGYAITVHAATPTELVSGESFTVELQLTEGAATVRDAAETVVSETAETDRIIRFGLRWDGEWTVEALGVETAE